ncbi:hypothetical protein K1T71_011119 [Dendrolimus kikuchii]|uniref:Uncharacterized protein n=1 Tax=Dendrolimus kikuchii TaxID=765133 RepID=A0ACC1CMY5_9NEOP|nr:hypothetical protein K1T71_011119 [Dendrolimus kikuchii]
MATEERFNKEAVDTIVDFLKANVPKNEIDNIETELKKDFVLAKRRSKNQRSKKKKKKVRCLTRNEKKKLNFFNIPRNSLKYEDIQSMNEIWLDYVSQLLELDKPIPECTSKSWETFTQSLYKADFHGSILKVVRSKCPSYVDKIGICIMDTRNTFKIICKENIITTIPKKGCVFEMYLKNIKITLFGKHLCVRPAERSTKKLKGHLHPDL